MTERARKPIEQLCTLQSPSEIYTPRPPQDRRRDRRGVKTKGWWWWCCWWVGGWGIKIWTRFFFPIIRSEQWKWKATVFSAPPPPKNTSKQITSEVSHGVIRDQSGVECKDLQNVIFISGNQSMDSEVWMKAAEPHAE